MRNALVSGLLGAAALPAQITVELTTATELQVSAFADFSVEQTIPAGTTLIDPTNLLATATRAFFNGAASADMNLRSTTTTGGVRGSLSARQQTHGLTRIAGH